MTRGMAMVLTLLVLAFALFAGWYSTRRIDYFPASFASTFIVCEVFPGQLDRQPVQHEVEDEMFSEELAAFQESSLYRRATTSPRSIRFTWLRSFHDPVVVRIDTLADGHLQLTAKQRPGGAGFPLDRGLHAAREQVRILSAEDAGRFDAILERTGVLEAPDSGCFCCVDGAQWIVEVSDPSIGYRYRSHQSPKYGIEREIGLAMLALTGWDVEPIY